MYNNRFRFNLSAQQKMKNRIKSYLSSWHFARILYLILGVASLWVGLFEKDSMYSIVGVLFLAQALFNISLCGAGSCGVRPPRKRFEAPPIEVKEYKHK